VFAALGRVVVRSPLQVILAWVVVSVAVVAFSPRLTDIINADQTTVTALIGQRAWWPGRIDRPLAGHAHEPDQLGRVEPTGNGSARSRSTRL
jgi:hypothetical protein